MSRKQAVIIIHGIGEQVPMGTLRDFVTSVWTSDKAVHLVDTEVSIWSKPDNLSKSYELRRLTTSQNKNGVITDFFEFYWAYMLEDTTYGQVISWVKTLLVRSPKTVPPQLRLTYWFLITLIVVSVGLIGLFFYLQGAKGPEIPKWIAGGVGVLIVPLFSFLVLRVVGDIARYLHVAPDNINSRRKIREAGVELIRDLHDPARGYERVVVVGHSLGSVIGYDILTHAWPEFNADPKIVAQVPDSLDELERLAAEPNPDINEVQRLQRNYHRELNAAGCKWLVTDFVTMGCPISHAAILLAKNLDDLKSKQVEREFPTCLPTLEKLTVDSVVNNQFTYPGKKKDSKAYRTPHHAAVFAPTRWTNLYFPCSMIIKGDIVGGPVCGVMGNGIKDVPVTTTQQRGYGIHTLYWAQSAKPDQDSHIDALRKAVNLLDQ